MDFTLTSHHQITIAETTPGTTIIRDVQDAVDLIGNCGYQGADCVIVHESNLDAAFFDLKTGLAGEVLQKFSTYGMRLVIVGDFSKLTSKSLQDFIRESNRTGRILFAGSTETAREALAQQ